MRCSDLWDFFSPGDHLDTIPPTDKTRREFLEWKIRFAEKGMADVCARLVKVVDRESDQT